MTFEELKQRHDSIYARIYVQESSQYVGLDWNKVYGQVWIQVHNGIYAHYWTRAIDQETVIIEQTKILSRFLK